MEAFLSSRKIYKVYHFTRAANLPNIIKHGLLSKDALSSLDIPVALNDPLRLDNQENAICMSIGFPNYKMFYSLRQQYKGENWVVLELTNKVLLDFDCAFCCTNAASSSVTCIDIPYRKGLQALEKLFAEVPGKPTRSELRLPDNYTTDPQAEVLVYGRVPTSYIDTVNFSNCLIKYKYADIIDNRIPSKVNQDLFYCRKDWQYWVK